MILSYNWLKEYIDLDIPPAELAERLTMAGVEVEATSEPAPPVKGVITAQVLAIKKHPDADKLVVCDVRTDSGTKKIVCGATNMEEGDKVALALPGSVLPGGIKIKKSKIRGVVSEGMMCSEVELSISDTSEGIMILPPDTPLGRDINEFLNAGDALLDIDITPNRADLLSVKGLAREAGAIFDLKVKDKAIKVEEKGGPVKGLVDVSLEAKDLCRRYAVRVVEGVRVGPSPEPVRKRLEACGVRPVNNVVDATNYVMLELGQPLHAFDLDIIKDKKIIVRKSLEGEVIETIDGVERSLDEGMLVIADSVGPVAVAGVMGGKNSEVADETRNILIESAWFEPTSVRRSSKSLNLSSDSSYRFERGVDIEGVVRALDMVTRMIVENSGGTVAKGIIDKYPKKMKPNEVEFRRERAEAILGVELKQGDVSDIFRRLNISTKGSGRKGVLVCRPPSYRYDITEEMDLVEEVIRLAGYDKVPTTMPVARLTPPTPQKDFEIKSKVKEILINLGFNEVINYSFVSRDNFILAGSKDREPVNILNPLTEEQVVMRDTLLPSLVENLRWNIARKNEEVRIFEFAPAFIHDGKVPKERWKASGLIYGLRWSENWTYPRQWCDFYDIKGVVERLMEGLGIEGSFTSGASYNGFFHPGKSAVLTIKGKEAGILGEIHPDIQSMYKLKRPAYSFELDMNYIADIFGEYKKYKAISRFPESSRDIAFVVDLNVPYQEIIDSIKGLDTKLIENVELFDVYCGGGIPEGKRSMALRIIYRRSDRTLTHTEVDETHMRVARELVERFKAEVRGEERV